MHIIKAPCSDPYLHTFCRIYHIYELILGYSKLTSKLGMPLVIVERQEVTSRLHGVLGDIGE